MGLRRSPLTPPRSATASKMVASTSLPTLRPPTVITGTPRAAPTSASLAAFFGPLPLPPHLTSRSPWATLPARLACSTSSKLTSPHRELVPSPFPRDLPTPLPPPSPRSTTTTTSATFLSSPTAPTVVSTMAKASASASTATVASPAKSRKPSSKRAVAPCTVQSAHVSCSTYTKIVLIVYTAPPAYLQHPRVCVYN